MMRRARCAPPSIFRRTRSASTARWSFRTCWACASRGSCSGRCRSRSRVRRRRSTRGISISRHGAPANRARRTGRRTMRRRGRSSKGNPHEPDWLADCARHCGRRAVAGADADCRDGPPGTHRHGDLRGDRPDRADLRAAAIGAGRSALMPIPNQTALVTEVKQDCLTRGVIPSPQTSNRDSFQITGRVAWRLRDKGAKLVLKNAAQNGYTLEDGPYAGARVSHDAIAFSDGWADCLTNAGPPANGNGPTWQWTATGPPAPGTVIDPYDLDATAP